jgi:hypothetical protein
MRHVDDVFGRKLGRLSQAFRRKWCEDASMMSASKDHPIKEEGSAHSDALALMHRYFEALDSRDFETVGGCFTQDASLSFHPAVPDPVTDAVRPVVGRSAIRDTARGVLQFHATTHVLASLAVSPSGNTFISKTRCVVYAVPREPDGSRLLLRGLLYTDCLVFDNSSELLIQERVHSLQWSTAISK